MADYSAVKLPDFQHVKNPLVCSSWYTLSTGSNALFEVFVAVGNNIYLFTTMQFDLYIFSFRAFADAGQMKQRLVYEPEVCQYCRR